MSAVSTPAQPETVRRSENDEICSTFHLWEMRCFAGIKLLGALALLILLLILESGLIVKTFHLEFGSSPAAVPTDARHSVPDTFAPCSCPCPQSRR